VAIVLTELGYETDRPTQQNRRNELVAEWVIRADSVQVVAHREDGAVVLVPHSAEAGTWQLPTRTAHVGETPLEAGIGALLTASGYRAARWSSSGISGISQTIRSPLHHLEARGVRLDPTISIERRKARWFDLAEAKSMALDGHIVEPIDALQLLRIAYREIG
jgi:hypothetical protein